MVASTCVWTSAYFTLIPKSGDKSNPGNWRPILQTNIFAKIWEKIVHCQLLSYFQEYKILSKFQFGFLPDKSTHESISKVRRHMYGTENNSKLIGVLFLDIAKDFNCINHNLGLLYKTMKDVGMLNRVVHWFRTYLAGSQTVKYGQTWSSDMEIPNGIAQGTVLGPLIFIFYINDCVNMLGKLRISMFADDCILYYSGNTSCYYAKGTGLLYKIDLAK